MSPGECSRELCTGWLRVCSCQCFWQVQYLVMLEWPDVNFGLPVQRCFFVLSTVSLQFHPNHIILRWLDLVQPNIIFAILRSQIWICIWGYIYILYSHGMFIHFIFMTVQSTPIKSRKKMFLKHWLGKLFGTFRVCQPLSREIGVVQCVVSCSLLVWAGIFESCCFSQTW